MQDAWRAYVELALGLTEVSKKKAQKVAKRLVGKGGATAAQMQALADDLLSASRTNRGELVKLIRFEVDRALGAVGLATEQEVAVLTARIHELERELREARAAATPPAPVTEPPAAEEPVAAPAPAKKAVAKKAPAKTTVAKKAVARKAPAKTTVAKKAVARKAPAKTTVAKKAAAGASAAKKAAPRGD